MTALPRSLLLDTNAWIANYIGGRSDAIGAQGLVDFCLSREIALCVSIPSMKDIYYGIGAYLKAETRKREGDVTESRAVAIEQLAWQSLCNLMENAVAVPIDSSDVAEARVLHGLHRDFEDNLIVAACKRAQADYLVTSDKKLLAKALVPTLSPADMLAFLEACEKPL